MFVVSANFDEMVFFFFFLATFGVITATTSADVFDNFITSVVFFFFDDTDFCFVVRMGETFVVLFSFDDGLVVHSEFPSDDDVDIAFLRIVFFVFAMTMLCRVEKSFVYVESFLE